MKNSIVKLCSLIVTILLALTLASCDDFAGVLGSLGGGNSVTDENKPEGESKPGDESKPGANEGTTDKIPVESVTLDKTELALKVGDSATLKATVSPANATEKSINWVSENPEIATVDKGVVVAVSAGETTITARAGNNVYASCTVTVSPKTVYAGSITLNKTELTLAAGRSETLVATILPENTAVKSIIWTSDNEEVVTVSGGTVTAVATGTATVTAKTLNGKTATCKVTVVEAVKAESVTLDKTVLMIKSGESVTLTATIAPENATNTTVVWKSLVPDVGGYDDSIATVEDGVVTGVSKGMAIIFAMVHNGEPIEHPTYPDNVYQFCVVYVDCVPTDSLTLDKTELYISSGESSKITATTNPENATVTWTSSDESVVTVVDGVATAVGPGQATITAVAFNTDWPPFELEQTCMVYVDCIPAESITVNKTSLTLRQGETATLVATVLPENSNQKIIWSSSDESVATVDNGDVTAVGYHGTATITAKANNSVFAIVTVQVVPVGQIVYDYTWDNTTLRIKYTNDDCNGELTSGCERYYAGKSADFWDIDDLVRGRNLGAAKAANVNVEWDYFAPSEGWGASTRVMVTEATSSSSNMPDIYYNFLYDISGAQLNGCFANLKGTSYANGNFFRFNESDYVYQGYNYFDSTVGEGYFYEYMQSLSLDNNKLYILASDFCIDVVRSFLVVPVNIELLESIKPEKTWTGDMTKFSDFYDLVWRTEEKYAEGWTYDVLAHYAENVYYNANDNGSDHALADVVGFAVGKTSRLAAAGLLYTADSVVAIDSNVQVDGTKAPAYPETNANLNALVSAISDLFSDNSGIVTVADGDFTEIGEADVTTALQVIRNRFAKDKVLFGGIITLGSLEDTVYQNMMADGGKGFGILPVPLYNNQDDYRTLVYNTAKVVAIAKNTTKFSQCSAYLDYLSRQSAEVIDEYYYLNLVSKTGGLAAAQNRLMLTYIRNHVKDSFAMNIEDSIGIWKSAAGEENTYKIHAIIADMGFAYPDFSNWYLAARNKKQRYLNEAVAEWNMFN